jgi:putative membrane protein
VLQGLRESDTVDSNGDSIMMWNYHSGYGWWWGFGALNMLLYWGMLILAIALLAKWLFARGGGGTPPARHPDKTALDILKERYARGEIGKEEFDQKKRDIES